MTVDAYIDGLIAACEAKAERVSKPSAVKVKGIGTVWVRPRLCSERDQFDADLKNGDMDAVARGVAALVCREDGSRPAPEARQKLAAVFARLPLNDLGVIGAAADGVDDAGN